MYWGLAGTPGTQEPEGVQGGSGALGAPKNVESVKGPFWGCKGASGGVGFRGVLGDWQ